MTVTLAPGFSSSRVFFFRDLTVYFYPLPELARRMLREGSLPLWNPYSAFGTPLAAMADGLLYYPGTWLRFLLPQPFGFNFFVIAHFYLAALGMYALARSLEMSRVAAFAAGTAFALSGPLLSLGSMLNVLVAAAWMPLAVLAARRAAQDPGAWNVLLLGAALAMQAIGGEPLFSLATAALALALCGAPFGRFLRVTVPAALFGMALIAVQLLPGMELLRRSVRQQFDFSSSAFWSLHPLNLVEMVLPAVLFEQGSPALRQFLYGTGQPYLASLYLGLLPLALAALALARSERSEARWTALCAAAFTAFSLGAHAAFYTLFYYLAPFVKQSRYPGKMVVCTAFCLALLAGWGLELLHKAEGRRQKAAGSMKWVLAILAGLLLRTILAEHGEVVWVLGELWRPLAGSLGAAHAAKLAALVILLGIVLRLARRQPRAAVAMALLALAADLALTGYHVNPTAPAEIFSQSSPLVPLVGGGSSDFRVDGDAKTTALRLPWREGWSPEALSALETRLALEFGAPLDGVRDARNLSPNKLFTPEQLAFRRRVEEWIHRREQAALGRLNVRYFVTTAKDPPPGVRQVATVSSLAQELAVWEIEGWRPRVEIAGGTARIVAETPTRVSVQAEAPAGGLLVLRDTYDDGWSARVDGARVKLELAEEVFRAVRVPAGTHRIDFAYRPWTFPAGLAISSAALMTLLAAALGRRSSTRSWNKPA